MSDQEDIQRRFEELEAGRALGDLDAQEILEWEELAKNPLCKPDLSLEFAASALEAESLVQGAPSLPEGLMNRLREDMATFASPEPVGRTIARPVSWRKWLSAPQTAWAVAAAFAILLAVNLLVQTPAPSPSEPVIAASTPEQSREILRKKAVDLFESDFGGIGEYRQMSGKVVWSDELQEGYLTLSRLPANDPTASQYQLWIVDPTRDEKPVDGGVFDIRPDRETTVIPIRNALAVNDPKAFVITLEQPGGVVVSKQQIVVASAAPL